MKIPNKLTRPWEAVWHFRRHVREAAHKIHQAKGHSQSHWRNVIGAPQIKNDYKFP